VVRRVCDLKGVNALIVYLAAAFAVAIPSLGWATPASPCVPRSFEGAPYVTCTIDLRKHHLRTFWADEDGEPYGGFSRLPRSFRGAPLVFAMNAGMYHADRSPVGLYIENGEIVRQANTRDGRGNFHLKPNGVFFIDGDRAGVLATERFLAKRPRVDFATQSGPMLVIDGQLHPRFLRHSDSRKIRNGVGMLDAHTAVFAISERPVTFFEFAQLFRQGLGVKNALFLDGSISRLYAPGLDRADAPFPMGPIVAAFAKP
jgi:uncharacterized protein YigE (DUF2233 family)